MKRTAAGLALAAALLGSTLAGTALGQTYDKQRDYDSRRGGYDSQRDTNDGSGRVSDWGRGSDRGQGRWNRASLEGRWVADETPADSRSGRGFRGRGGMQSLMLPEFIRIDQRPRMVQIADSRNRLLQRILIDARFDPRDEGRTDNLVGHWRGSTLVVERTGPRGATITQTLALENRGRTLVVRTRREGRGFGRTTEFTNVYHRA